MWSKIYSQETVIDEERSKIGDSGPLMFILYFYSGLALNITVILNVKKNEKVNRLRTISVTVTLYSFLG